jgi:hypothetical protein
MQIAVMFIVPPVAVMLTKRPDLLRQYDLSCVMAIYCSAAPLAIDVEKELAALLPGLIFHRAKQGNLGSYYSMWTHLFSSSTACCVTRFDIPSNSHLNCKMTFNL